MSNESVSPIGWPPYFVCRQLDPEQQRAMLRMAYSLRHEVYCLERSFLPAENYPDGIETDQFDEQSAHFSAYNLLGELVGYVRLVPVRENGNFPFEQHCRELFPHIELPPRHQAAEVSRMIVRQDYRRRRGDTLAGVTIQTIEPSGKVVAHDRRKPPLMLLGLLRQAYMFSVRSGIQYWYAAMEKPLARVMSQIGFPHVKISPEIDYYGQVACYVLDLREFEEHLRRTRPEVLMWFRQEIL